MSAFLHTLEDYIFHIHHDISTHRSAFCPLPLNVDMITVPSYHPFAFIRALHLLSAETHLPLFYHIFFPTTTRHIKWFINNVSKAILYREKSNGAFCVVLYQCVFRILYFLTVSGTLVAAKPDRRQCRNICEQFISRSAHKPSVK